MRKGFVLMEVITVIVIIGVLASLSVYAILNAQASARDAKRKSDLFAISQGFESRRLDRTCVGNEAGQYPGNRLGSLEEGQPWREVDLAMSSGSDICGRGLAFYLPTLPEDPDPNFPYRFNLSTRSELGSAGANRHYRLAARLERGSTVSLEDCRRASNIWTTVYGGLPYDCDQPWALRVPVGHQKKDLICPLTERASAQRPRPCPECIRLPELSEEYQRCLSECMRRLQPGPLPPPPSPTEPTPDDGRDRYNYYIGR